MGFCLALVALNLLFAVVEGNLFELSAVLVLIIEILREEEQQYYTYVFWVSLLLISKDLLFMFVFDLTDYSDFFLKLEGGDTLLEIVKYAHVPGILFKLAIFMSIFMLKTEKKDAN